MQLTIAIPSYNRNDILNQSLERLLPQVSSRCRVLILDNCSPVLVSRTIGPIVARFPGVRVDVHRNASNIGMCPNIARCFELCETKWLWLLGDDDKVLPNAVETVLSQVTTHEDCIYTNFASELCNRSETKVTTGLDDFIRAMDSFSNVMLLSTGLFDASAVRPALRFAYQYSYSMGPHLAIVLSSIGQHGNCCYSTDRVVNWQPNERGDKWSDIHLGLGAMTVLELCPGAQAKKVLASRITAGIPSLRSYFRMVLLSALRTADSRDAIFQFDQICQRLTYFESGVTRRLKVTAMRKFLRLPLPVIRMLYRFRGSRRSLDNAHAGEESFRGKF